MTSYVVAHNSMMEEHPESLRGNPFYQPSTYLSPEKLKERYEKEATQLMRTAFNRDLEKSHVRTFLRDHFRDTKYGDDQHHTYDSEDEYKLILKPGPKKKKPEPSNEPNLNSMDRGCAKFEPHQWQFVYEHMAQDYAVPQTRKTLTYSQTVPDTCRIFFELDAKLKCDLDFETQWRPVLLKIHEMVHRYYPQTPKMKVAIYSCPSKVARKIHADGRHEYTLRSGIHMIYNKVITILHLCEMITGIKAVLQNEFGLGDLIDEDPAANEKSAHLRLPFNLKTVKCSDCDNIRGEKEECNRCFARGKMIHPSMYRLYQIWDYQGNVLENDTKIVRSSVQHEITAGGIYSKSPVDPNFRLVHNLPRYIPRKLRTKSTKFDRSKGSLVNDCKLRKAIKTMVDGIGDPLSHHRPYRNSVIGKIKCSETSKGNIQSYLVTLVSGPVHLCHVAEKRGHEHSSNTIFFVITPKGIYQSCNKKECARLVSADTMGKDGFRKIYPFLDYKVRDVLFPSSKKPLQLHQKSMTSAQRWGAFFSTFGNHGKSGANEKEK